MNERDFFRRVASHVAQVSQYNRVDLQEAALKVIPLSSLQEKAKNSVKNSDGSSKLDADQKMAFLRQLLLWFKKDFFRWMDKPQCSGCESSAAEMQMCGNTPPTPLESSLGAGRVELYKCAKCQREARFARYNNAGTLLQTREGRCGEWANCFTLCAKAVGFEVRMVYDWTDHVWTEVWWPDGNRWVHCDACESALDKPMLYESGWGKKLTYCIAVGADNVADVTWRYSVDPLSRRKDIAERRLIGFLMRTNTRLQSNLPLERKTLLEQRYLREVVELIRVAGAENDCKEGLPGRQSGSLQWRLHRGELGQSSSASVTAVATTKSSVIVLSDLEKARKHLSLSYSAVSDSYRRQNFASDADQCKFKGWQSLVYEASNVFRKVEHDWDMVYLARNENSPQGSQGKVVWCFDMPANTKISAFEVQLKSETFESGKVRVTLCIGDDTCFMADKNGRISLHASDLPDNDVRTIKLEATLFGGNGDCAWQHAQLFRTNMTTDAGVDGEFWGLKVDMKFV